MPPNSVTSSALTRVAALVDAFRTAHPEIEVRAPAPATRRYGHDVATAPRAPGTGAGPAVAFPSSAAQVQTVVRLAAEYGISIVPRGAGTGLAGGAAATIEQLVVSTERLSRIIEVAPLDEVVVVEPGVVNADLNAHLAPYGCFYAPDPASSHISTIGGNIATNAGGLRCAKYGVTRESVLALDVVLADGSLISTGHRSVKGVTGLDLVSLFVGSEGTLGIIVAATLRIRPLPVARRTVTASFDTTLEGVDALAAITASTVRPSIVEFLDEPTLRNIDRHSGSALRARGGALILIELDGYGIDEQTDVLRAALEAVGGRVRTETDADATVLWELRRSGRGRDDDTWLAGGDIAVPKSRLRDVYASFAGLERRYGVAISAVAHAGDGNLHPVVALPMPAGADPAAAPRALQDAVDELTRIALALGGTVSGEHGIGSLRREAAALELDPRSLRAQLALVRALDPHGHLNPGKAL